MAFVGTIGAVRICRQMPVKSLLVSPRRWTQAGATKPTSASPSQNVPGLSQACIQPATGEVGPGASKNGNYKNPEYFLYHHTSYFEAEIEMAKYRLQQPSSKSAK